MIWSYIPETFFSPPSINKSFCKFNFFSCSNHLANYFSFYFTNFCFFQYSKTIFRFFWHTRACKFLVVAKKRQYCLIISKETLNMFNLFILKWKMIKHHFNMILLELLCILAFNYVFIIDKNPQENP